MCAHTQNFYGLFLQTQYKKLYVSEHAQLIFCIYLFFYPQIFFILLLKFTG